MTITGTSSIHDWESIVNDFSVYADVNDESIIDLAVEVEVKSIKSGKSIMDGKTYDALQADEFPKILFKASNLNIGIEKIEGLGTLTIAGQSKSIPISADILTRSASDLKVKGRVHISMSKFGITPPKAMFGTLKTGDLVVIEYELVLKNNKNITQNN